MGIHWQQGPIALDVFAHFIVDFSISGLIAVTYSYFAVQAIVLRSLYVPFLVGAKSPRTVSNQELRSVPAWLRLAQIGSGVIPLIGAVLLVFLGPANWHNDWMFKGLVLVLIGFGMFGFSFSVRIGNELHNTLRSICGKS